MSGMLVDKRILVTGMTTHRSIAFAVAKAAQEQGAEIVLTTFGERRAMTERAARRLPDPPPALELDVRKEEDFSSLAAELERRWGRLDGLVHSIGFAPPEAIEGPFSATPSAAALETFEISAVSLSLLAHALSPLLERAGGAGIVALDFDAS